MELMEPTKTKDAGYTLFKALQDLLISFTSVRLALIHRAFSELRRIVIFGPEWNYTFLGLECHVKGLSKMVF